MSNKFIRVDEKSWKQYGKDILSFEKEYPPSLAASENDYREHLERQGSIYLLLVNGDTSVGCVVGYPLEKEETEEYHVAEYWSDGDIYLESITVSAGYQGKGYGKLLLSEFIDVSRKEGFKRIIGHFRPGSSEFLMRKEGAQEYARERNWYGSGEDYPCLVLSLG